ncbi:hypothetical protein L3N51_01927 [Metallosphaera sp. J1]|nr:hypothetical protein [Metallosphaera javensis (ex Hofmann et al. 2022)]
MEETEKKRGVTIFTRDNRRITENDLKRFEDLERFLKAREEFKQVSERLRQLSYDVDKRREEKDHHNTD